MKLLALSLMALASCAALPGCATQPDYGARETFTIVETDPNAPPVRYEKPCTAHCRVPTERDLQILEEVRIHREVARIIEENHLRPRAFKRAPHWK